MSMIASRFSPWGRTSRRHYRFAIVLFSASVVAIWMAGSAINPTSLLVASIVLQSLVAVLTIRRLHDAGLSRLLVFLFIFPMLIDVDLANFRLGEADFHLLNIATVIRSLPVVFGLICASKSPVEQAENASLGASPV